MRSNKMLARALGVESGICGRVEELAGEAGFVVHIRLRARDKGRCPECQAKCGGYDQSTTTRRWRTHPLGLGKTFIEALVPRVRCPKHGVRVAYVPWARARSGFTESYEDQLTWLTLRTDRTTVCSMHHVSWRTIGRILVRVEKTMRKLAPPLDNVTRIGIDEVSYRKGHRYLTIVVDHDTGRLLWARKGHDKATLRRFFNKFGKRRCRKIQLVSADAAPWIAAVVREKCPNAERRALSAPPSAQVTH